MDLDERARRLAAAGIELLRPWPLADGVVTPPDVAWSASSCGPDSGRVDRVVQDADERRVAKGNEAWWDLAHRFALFDGAGTFLLSVATGPEDTAPSQWFRARLAVAWDLVGAGAEAEVLGYGHAQPAFVTHSADGAVLIAASSYETFFSVFAVPHPHRSDDLRRSATRWLKRADGPPARRIGLTTWLERPR